MSEESLINIAGCVEHIVYRNEDNGYTVMEISSNEELITVVGEIAGIDVGEELKLIGKYIVHPQYGSQFRAEVCERRFPETKGAILKYLSSGAIKGIGPSIASKIVDRFGDDALKVIENDYKRLSEIKGISESKAEQISNEFKKIYGIKYLMVYLAKFNLNQSEIVRVWKKLGLLAIETIESNPFVLCCYEIGIEFLRADEIRKLLNIPETAQCRLEAGVTYILRHNNKNGHTCLPKAQLVEITSGMMEVDIEEVENTVQVLIDNNEIVIDSCGGKEMAFLKYYHDAERFIASRIVMMTALSTANFQDIDQHIAGEEKELYIEFETKQKKAIKEAMTQGVMILTGGPGTGKTTTINAIIRLCEKFGQKVFLAAPTGRAAKRMSDVTKKEAKTIHRLLEVDFSEGELPKFKKNENNPLNCDVIIIDEISMVDTLLFESLLRAMKIGARLILVGDSDQLPSVGAGCILKDLVESDCVTAVELTQIFRQAAESLIITNAHSIVKGEMPDLDIKNNDFFFLQSGDYEKSADLVVDLCNRRLPKSYGFSPFDDIQVLAPGRKGELGTFELNKSLQNVINPHSTKKVEYKFGAITFREGDKVMQIKNNYDLIWENDDGEQGTGIFNGDIGVISKIDKTTNCLVIKFDDRSATYPFELLSEVEHAYAVTVHKSQGSEFNAVILVLMNGFEKLYYRNILYTAVTRAKKLLIIIGKKETVAKMVNNNRKIKRFTGLKSFIQDVAFE